jgi:Metallo-beta-lactamase superfamily
VATPPPVFRVEMLPARHGDCILVEYGYGDPLHRILIDAGPADTIDDLSERLRGTGDPPHEIELLVVTHVDSDHIAGLVHMLNRAEPRLLLRDIWFNGWPQLCRPLQGDVPFVPPSHHVHRGPLEGSFAELLLEPWKDQWNRMFGQRAVLVPDSGPLPTFDLPCGMRLTLLSPSASQLQKLREKWQDVLDKQGLDPDDQDGLRKRLEARKDFRGDRGSSPAGSGSFGELEAIAARLDDSAANGSSIAFVAEFAGKKCAFLADAHAPQIVDSIWRMEAEGDGRVAFDAIKVSHHGSIANLTKELLKSVRCNSFLFSTDGSKHKHPDDACVALTLTHVPEAQLVFNYRSTQTEKWDASVKSGAIHRTKYPRAGNAGIVFDMMQGTTC